MITDAILTVLSAIPMALLSLLPAVDVTIPSGVFDWLFDVASAVGYIFPVKSLLAILGVSLAIRGFHIIWALILRVKSFVPTMGA